VRIAIYAAIAVSFLVVPGQSAPIAQHGQHSFCGWIGVQVRPITAAFADSLGMAEPYGAIFAKPDPDSPAANAGIEEGDVITEIEGSPLRRARDFAKIISAMPPGSLIHLTTFRNGELIELELMLGSSKCRMSGNLGGPATSGG
jgi:S1-C subfamily serine protease